MNKIIIIIIIMTVFAGPRRGVKKKRFQQTRSTHSGAGEKETLNIKLWGIVEDLCFKLTKEH